MDEREQKIQKLKEYFEKRDDIVMAFVFGSQAEPEGRVHSHSDWDIAIYFKPETVEVEWEERGREYLEEDRVWSDCINIVKTDNVDLIVLNRAPASIADAAIRGTPLVMKDRKIWLRFMLTITREAEDYRRFAHEFYEIAQRSTSLNSRDREDLEKTIQFLEEQMTLYSYFNNLTGGDYEEDVHKRNDVERWIEKIMVAIIDISKLIMGSQKKLIPESYVESMRRITLSLHLPEDFIAKFERWVKLRNVLAHEYLDIKWKRISNFIQESEPYIKQFIAATKHFLEQNQQKEDI